MNKRVANGACTIIYDTLFKSMIIIKLMNLGMWTETTPLTQGDGEKDAREVKDIYGEEDIKTSLHSPVIGRHSSSSFSLLYDTEKSICELDKIEYGLDTWLEFVRLTRLIYPVVRQFSIQFFGVGSNVFIRCLPTFSSTSRDSRSLSS